MPEHRDSWWDNFKRIMGVRPQEEKKDHSTPPPPVVKDAEKLNRYIELQEMGARREEAASKLDAARKLREAGFVEAADNLERRVAYLEEAVAILTREDYPG